MLLRKYNKSMVRTIKTDALVLRKRSLLDKDILLTFLTKDFGKVFAIAKGVKKITSRRSAHTQTGNLVTIELYARGETYYLQNTNIISAFSQIKNNPVKMNYLYRFIFILDRTLPEQQAEPEIYALAVKFLIFVSKAQSISPDEFARYLQDLMRVLGYGAEEKSLSDIIRKIEEIIHEKIPEHVII